jgi:tetratricopeptide (TPR) repeat protein
VVQLPEHWSGDNRPNSEFRIVAIGGSTMLGFPYHPKVDIPTICQAHFESRFPDRTFTVENVALTGINFRTAIARLERIPTRPDLILLYTGHNECFFDVDNDVIRPESSVPLVDHCFDWSSAYRAFSKFAEQRYSARRERANEGRRFFEAPRFSEPVAQERLERFRQTLVQFARALRQQEISTIWFVPGSGEGTFEPNRSCSRGPVSADRQETIRGQLDEARSLEQAGLWQNAEEVYRSLLNDDPRFAEFHFRLAEALVQQDRFMEAKQSFHAAIDFDGDPCRASSHYRQCIADVAMQEHIPLIDAVEELSAITATGLLDRTVIHDNVHMTLRGYLTLGRAAAERAVAMSLLGDAASPPASQVEFDDAAFLAETGFDARDLATAYDRTAFVLDHFTRHRYDPARRKAEAAQYRYWAEALRTGAIEPGAQGTESLTQLEPGGVRLMLPSRVWPD